MPVTGRRRLIRPVQNSDWTSTIPSVYSLSLLDFDAPRLTTTPDSRVASFYKYVEAQRLPRGLKGSRSLKNTAIELLIRNLSELDNLNDIPKHLTKFLWDTLKRRYVGFLSGRIDAGQ